MAKLKIKNQFDDTYLQKISKTLQGFKLSNPHPKKYTCTYENCFTLEQDDNKNFQIEAHNKQFKIISNNLEHFLNLQSFNKMQQLNQLSQITTNFTYNYNTQEMIWIDPISNFKITFKSIWTLDQILQVQLEQISAIFKTIKSFNEQIRYLNQTNCLVKLLSVDLEIDFNKNKNQLLVNQSDQQPNYPNILKTKWKCELWFNDHFEIIEDYPINQINPQLNNYLTTWSYWKNNFNTMSLT